MTPELEWMERKLREEKTLKEKLEEGCNPYRLLDDKVEATEKIDTAIGEFVESMVEIRKEHPEAGIGDTTTDQKIKEDLYKRLHHDMF